MSLKVTQNIAVCSCPVGLWRKKGSSVPCGHTCTQERTCVKRTSDSRTLAARKGRPTVVADVQLQPSRRQRQRIQEASRRRAALPQLQAPVKKVTKVTALRTGRRKPRKVRLIQKTLPEPVETRPRAPFWPRSLGPHWGTGPHMTSFSLFTIFGCGRL